MSRPVVADFAAGYRLIGGRVGYLDHQRAAVVVYQHGSHVINVFSWARDAPPIAGREDPQRLSLGLLESRRNLQYCAVSDTSWDELLGLVRLLQQLGRPRCTIARSTQSGINRRARRSLLS